MWKNLLLLAAACLIALLGAEGYVRWVHPQPLNRFGTAEAAQRAIVPPIYQPSPTRIYELRPGAGTRMISPYGDFEADVSINSLGFRGLEVSFEKPSGVRRVIMIGDSYTFGFGADDLETFSVHLERRLNGEGKGKYEVLNLGVPGYNLDHYYLVFKENALGLNPDFVVLALFPWNDFYLDERGQHRVREKDGLPEVLKADVYVDKDGRVRFKTEAVDLLVSSKWNIFPEFLRRFLRKHSHLYYYTGEQLFSSRSKSRKRPAAKPAPPDAGRKANGTAGSEEKAASKRAATRRKQPSAKVYRHWENGLRILSEIHEVLRARQIPWMVMVLPYRKDIALLREGKKLMPLRGAQNGDIRPLFRWFKDRGVPVLNLLAALEPYVDWKARHHYRLFNLYDNHFSIRGNRKVAEVLHRRLRQVWNRPPGPPHQDANEKTPK